MKPPVWTRDEVILAYRLYKEKSGQVSDAEALTLCHSLWRLNMCEGGNRTFRTPDAVVMKVANLQFVETEGLHGMQAGSQLDADVVAQFKDRPEQLSEIADSIQRRVEEECPGGSAWLVRAWNGITAHEFTSRSAVALNLPDIPDPSGLDLAEIRALLSAAQPQLTQGKVANYATWLDMMANRMQSGDLVMTTSDNESEVMIGYLEGPYRYADDEADARWRHQRGVRWLDEHHARDSIPPRLRRTLGAPHTVCPIDPTEVTQVLSGPLPEPPCHLLLRFSLQPEPTVIAKHKAIADEAGSVWWGKRGDPEGRPAMSEEMLDRFQRQLEAETPTYVYLYRTGEEWRCRLVALTKAVENVDMSLVPAYWREAPCHLWARLSDFQQLESGWAATHLRRLESGQPVGAALAGRSSLLYVRADEPEAGQPLPEATTPNPFTVDEVRDIASQRGLLLTDDVYAAVVAALEAGKHIVLTGPPGTAKTTLALAVAEAAERAGRCRGWVPTTATADWTTFDTIGGLRPSGPDELRFAPGHFVQAIQQDRWLVIDELNRSNFDRAFGQLFTVLSGQSVVLPYEYEDTRKLIALVPEGDSEPPGCFIIWVPASWRVIATMNVFDKSLLFEMSFALMRRFAFIEVPAPTDEVYQQLIAREVGDDTEAASITMSLLPLRKHKELGPAMFMDAARFIVERRKVGPVSDPDLRFQAFYSYLLPQFEGIGDETGRMLFAQVAKMVGAANRIRLHRVLTEVLGVALPKVGPVPDELEEGIGQGPAEDVDEGAEPALDGEELDG